MKRIVPALVGIIVATLAGVTGVATLSPAAQASAYEFCPAAADSQVYISGNGRCVGGYAFTVSQVVARTSNGDGVDHCAVAKQYSNGGGANIIEPACGTAQTQVTACVSRRAGYPTIVNRSSSGHYFKGTWYNTYC